MAQKLSKRKWQGLAEEKLYAEQSAEIEKKCGKKAAGQANYGWGSACDDGFIDIATKVYGKKPRILCSRVEYPSLEVSHEWRDY